MCGIKNKINKIKVNKYTLKSKHFTIQNLLAMNLLNNGYIKLFGHFVFIKY